MDSVFFVISKLAGFFLRPDTWIIIALAGIVVALLKKRQRIALTLSGMTLFALLILAVFPIGELLLKPIEKTYPLEPPLTKVDGIIVLGGGGSVGASSYWGQIQLNAAGDRFTAGLLLAKRFPNAKLLFTGGSGQLRDLVGSEVSEADLAGRFFLDLGVSQNRLLLEKKSRNTAENAQLSFELAAPSNEETWVLVTSAFHMPRAMQSFKAVGWPNLLPWPVDYRTSSLQDRIGWDLTWNLQILEWAIREHVGGLAYRLSGR